MIPLRDNIPSGKLPLVTLLLILANSAIFLYAVSLPGQAREELFSGAGLIPANLFRGSETADRALPAGLTLFTSLFLHGGFWHIAGNMLFLWIFGDNVEDRLGHARFAGFYLACGIIANFAHAWQFPDSGVPLIGASGAISGVLGAYILFFPRARIQTLVFIGIFITVIRVPAFVFIGVWALLQLLNILSKEPSHIAWIAHAGGFAAGTAAAFISGGRRG